MALLSADHQELMSMFERIFTHMRLDKEDKSMWPKGYIYQSGETNNLFLAFRQGDAFGRARK